MSPEIPDTEPRYVCEHCGRSVLAREVERRLRTRRPSTTDKPARFGWAVVFLGPPFCVEDSHEMIRQPPFEFGD